MRRHRLLRLVLTFEIIPAVVIVNIGAGHSWHSLSFVLIWPFWSSWISWTIFRFKNNVSPRNGNHLLQWTPNDSNLFSWSIKLEYWIAAIAHTTSRKHPCHSYHKVKCCTFVVIHVHMTTLKVNKPFQNHEMGKSSHRISLTFFFFKGISV